MEIRATLRRGETGAEREGSGSVDRTGAAAESESSARWLCPQLCGSDAAELVSGGSDGSNPRPLNSTLRSALSSASEPSPPPPSLLRCSAPPRCALSLSASLLLPFSSSALRAGAQLGEDDQRRCRASAAILVLVPLRRCPCAAAADLRISAVIPPPEAVAVATAVLRLCGWDCSARCLRRCGSSAASRGSDAERAAGAPPLPHHRGHRLPLDHLSAPLDTHHPTTILCSCPLSLSSSEVMSTLPSVRCGSSMLLLRLI